MKRHLPVILLCAVLTAGLFTPLVTGASSPGFWVEVLLGGLMAGVLYSLVALGLVLIFKASGVFNFAQGAMVLFAALAVARLSEKMPMWAAVLIAIGIMVLFAVVVERLVLRPLVNQEPIALLMATLGVSYFLDGFGQTLWGGDIYKIEFGISKDPVMILESLFQGGILVNKDDMAAALVAIALVALLALFFQKTATGRALRAVADDHAVDRDPAQPHLGHRVVRSRHRRAGGGHGLGRQAGGAVFARRGGAQGAPRGDPRGLRVGARGDHRRAHHRRGREDGRGVFRPGAREDL
jgi:ABC-type branched-subunit amino acid transport system permease subunit